MFAQQVANGVFVGAVYALFAIGYTLIFGVLDILNLAHAAIFTAAAFAALALLGAGLPLAAAFVLAVAIAGLLGIVLDRVAFAPLRRRNAGTLAPLISSIGAAIVLEGILRGLYGPDERRFPEGLIATAHFRVGPLTLGALDLVILIVALALMLVLSYTMRSTALGRSIRAVADDRTAAALLGIDLERTIALTFFIASALGGAAGILIGLQYDSVSLEMGSRIELKGLAIIVLGGMGSITGAVIGALILGVVETLSVAYISSSYRDAIAFGVMFLILVLRPTGILGKRALRSA
ncbi:MAG TPA: branched-chain amino acid ABC transporter permease [Candidatus Baltobacteraceae bacterium]|nr:branched-chain amino acid ABC transporter permease [Candidatus Baltobacteraceae bacterium]